MCLDLKSRYSFSRKAKKKTLEIDGLLRDAQPFVIKVSYAPPPPQGIGSSSIEGFKAFESRISIMKDVFEALRDDKINMIAICGMGGIGKTTMAKEVAKRAKDDKLFDEVAIAVVSQNQDLRKIQGDSDPVLDIDWMGTARGLVQLQELSISSCYYLEEIFSKEGEDEKAVDMIKFPKLKLISLSILRRLIGFYKPMDPVELVQPSHAESTQPSFNLEVYIVPSLSLVL
ncbi:disease resistance protein At4g27190-like [Fagus crenata]